MANANRPAGLIPVKYLNGARWNEQANIYYIAQSDTNAYAVGDPVSTAVGRADINGVSAVTLTTAGTGSMIRGVIVGLGTAESMMGQPNGSSLSKIPATKTQAYYVMVADDPHIIFEIQANDNHYSAADIGNNCNLLSGVSNGYVSGWQIDDSVASTLASSAGQLRLLGVSRRMGNTLGQSNAAFLVLINQHELGGVAEGVQFALNANGNPVGLVGPDGNIFLQTDGAGNLVANVNLRTDTAANLAGVTGGASELAYASDVVTVGAQVGTGQLVMMGTGVTHAKTFYSGTALTQLGLAAPISNGSTVQLNSVSTLAYSLGTGSIGIFSAPASVNTANLSSTLNIGNGSGASAAGATVIGNLSLAATSNGFVIGNNNGNGEIFNGDFVYGNGNSIAVNTVGSNSIRGITTTAAGNTYKLTFDGSAAIAPLATPAITTASAAAGGTLYVGTHTIQVTLTNVWGESAISAVQNVTTTTTNKSISVPAPTQGAATGWNVYLDGYFYASYSTFTAQTVSAPIASNATNGMPVNSAASQFPINGTSNQLALIAPVQGILIATFDIAVRDTTAVGATVFVGQRQVMYSVSAAGALTMLSAASGATVGTDVNNITATYFTPATGIVFGVDNTNASFPILSLTIGNTAVTGVHALSAVANVHYSFVGI
jgi:hypothetical protein